MVQRHRRVWFVTGSTSGFVGALEETSLGRRLRVGRVVEGLVLSIVTVW
jgi:hypothetical protein